ncbi:MAG: 5' nucleotidase, NT5C type [Bradymonadia bacterium]
MEDTNPASDPIALIDLDGTLADYDGAMRRELAKLCSDEELAIMQAAPNLHALEHEGAHWEARMDLIKRLPGWWFGLARLEQNFALVEVMRRLDFDLHILTKGPWAKGLAWAEKVEWCQEHIPDAEVHITGSRTGKGMVYGKVLFDDYPPYVESWLKWRHRGLAILPAQPWNEGFTHDNAIRWDGSAQAREAIVTRLTEIRASCD